jgi:hypothetical protein
MKTNTTRSYLIGLAGLVVLAAGLSASAGSAKKDIVDTAVAAGSFNTLATALKEADLIDTLKGKGPFTVFAPTDDAFAKLPDGGGRGEAEFGQDREWPVGFYPSEGRRRPGGQRSCHQDRHCHFEWRHPRH